MSDHQKTYEVIIIGGGPVGVALGIELGLRNIKTLILEKYAQPLHTPRAQSLSARTMEFFLRWGIDKILADNLLLPKNLPQTGIWCDSLYGEAFFVSLWGDNQLAENASPKEGVRIPLWVTEKVLRQRLLEFPCVDFLKQHEVQDIQYIDDQLIVHSLDKVNKTLRTHKAPYLACCDGASGISKSKFNNSFHPLSEKTKMVGTLFISKEIMANKTVPDGIMYFVISDEAMAFVGPIDLNEGLWLAQIIWQDQSQNPNEQILSTTIDKMIGTKLDKIIVDYYVWDMQVQLADFFNLDNRIFWVGDAAHAFAPTGGLGLNTGFGDAQNLGWKLAAVIKNEANPELLATYQKERYPVWLNNLNFAKQNAEEFIEVRKKFPPAKDQKAFARAYADLGNRYLSSSGLTLGYSYLDSPLTFASEKQHNEFNPFEYTPKVEAGYFLPHIIFKGATIYEKLSATKWNLIICGQNNIENTDIEIMKKHFSLTDIHILEIDENMYPYSYLLVRPDWHIAKLGKSLA